MYGSSRKYKWRREILNMKSKSSICAIKISLIVSKLFASRQLALKTCSNLFQQLLYVHSTYPWCALHSNSHSMWITLYCSLFGNVAISVILSSFYIITFDWNWNFEFWLFHQKDLVEIYKNIYHISNCIFFIKRLKYIFTYIYICIAFHSK